MLNVRITPMADVDIDGHAAYIAQNSPATALRFIGAAESTFQLLAKLPLVGIACEGFIGNPSLKGLRLWRIKGFPNHLILYQAVDSWLLVVRVLHSKRDLEAI